MTHYLSHVSQTSLGQTCASYVDSLTDHLSPSFRAVEKFVLLAKASSPPTPAWIPDYVLSADAKTTSFLLLPVLTLLLVLYFAMSSWRDFFRRPAPPAAYSNVANPPYVSDRDYDYIAGGDESAYDTAPDTVLLRHRRNTYELQFPPYAINEGRLRVGQLRLRAAEVTHTADPKRIKLLYKGTLLDDDSRPCCDEGLKQHSEVLCVVSGVTPSDDPGSDEAEAAPSPITHTTTTASTTPSEDPEQPAQPRKRVRNRGKKGKKSKNRRAVDETNDDDEAAAPSPGPAAGSGSGSGMPAPAPNLRLFATALDKARALSNYLRQELLPLCEAYIASPPMDEKTREFEYKKLSETILAQVILRADGIEPENDEERMARKALVKEAQMTLNRLDMARGDHA